MFSETLPADHLYRMWDIFLFEGELYHAAVLVWDKEFHAELPPFV
jgi:hypothetical protein